MSYRNFHKCLVAPLGPYAELFGDVTPAVEKTLKVKFHYWRDDVVTCLEFPLRLEFPRWCHKTTLTINNEPSADVSPGEKFYEIRRPWKPGDTVTLDMPMPWRLVRGYKVQDGRAALMRGPVVYCIGTAANADLLKKYPEPRDPTSLGEPVADTSVRPEGLKVTAKAWPPGGHGKGPASLDVVLTEFVDPSGIATYFRISELSQAVDDELMSDDSLE